MPLRVQGRTMHQVGLPYHWGSNGLSRGDSANELLHIALDPNVHIQGATPATSGTADVPAARTCRRLSRATGVGPA